MSAYDLLLIVYPSVRLIRLYLFYISPWQLYLFYISPWLYIFISLTGFISLPGFISPMVSRRRSELTASPSVNSRMLTTTSYRSIHYSCVIYIYAISAITCNIYVLIFFTKFLHYYISTSPTLGDSFLFPFTVLILFPYLFPNSVLFTFIFTFIFTTSVLFNFALTTSVIFCYKMEYI